MIALRGVVLKPRKGFFLNNNGGSSSSSFSPPSKLVGRSKSSPAMENNKAAVEAAAQKHVAATTSTSSSPPILASLVAATAGIGVVAMAAQVVDRWSSSTPVPPFDGHRQRFDQATFTGRFSRMLLQCDPSLLLYSDQQIRRAQERLQQATAFAVTANGGSGRSAVTDHELWTAKRLVESAVNDQNKIIPQCFRMSGYVPYK
jgi:Sideroflexins